MNILVIISIVCFIGVLVCYILDNFGKENEEYHNLEEELQIFNDYPELPKIKDLKGNYLKNLMNIVVV